VLRAWLKYSTEVGTVTPQLPVGILPSGFTQLFVAPKRLLNGRVKLAATLLPNSPHRKPTLIGSSTDRLSAGGARIPPDVRLANWHSLTLLAGGCFLLRGSLFFGRSRNSRHAFTFFRPASTKGTSPDFATSRSLIAFAHR